MKIYKMKTKIFLSLLISAFAFNFSLAQKTSLLKMGFQERKAEIRKMSPKQKSDALKQLKEDLVLSELQIPDERKEDFIEIYTEYQTKQKEIKNKFKPKGNFDVMTDTEANSELQSSFEIGQELLDLRIEYVEKFKTIIKPQKILQLFQTEGMMRNKMMNHQIPQ